MVRALELCSLVPSKLTLLYGRKTRFCCFVNSYSNYVLACLSLNFLFFFIEEINITVSFKQCLWVQVMILRRQAGVGPWMWILSGGPLSRLRMGSLPPHLLTMILMMMMVVCSLCWYLSSFLFIFVLSFFLQDNMWGWKKKIKGWTNSEIFLLNQAWEKRK